MTRTMPSDHRPRAYPGPGRHLRGRYWSDGMVRVIGREFNSLIESKCYRAGTLSCLSCHSMHSSDPNNQLAAGMDTDRACVQCHPQVGTNVAQHTHHAAGSEGSRCYNCHMPYTSYGLLKAARSHQINSPTVAASVQPAAPTPAISAIWISHCPGPDSICKLGTARPLSN